MSQIVTAYHTIENRGNLDYVLDNAPFICTREDAWLGNGYYFWDTNVAWAKKWGRDAYLSRSKGFWILLCQLDLRQNCLDLFGSVADKQLLVKVLQRLK